MLRMDDALDLPNSLEFGRSVKIVVRRSYSMHDDTDLDWLNKLPTDDAIERFRGCCGSESWCRAMVQHRPFATIAELHRMVDRAMDELDERDWLQAFESHPQIGDLTSLRMKFTGNKDWSAAEQSGVATANDQILTELAEGNAEYLAKFGFIFIVCASGKSAAELLSCLQLRLPLDLAVELRNAVAEQRKITHLRIDKIESITP